MQDIAKRSLIDRMIGAAMLDVGVYEEVEHDTTATKQAAIVVGIAAVASAIGGAAQGGDRGTIAALVGVAAAFVGWGIWSWVTYFVGTRLFEGTADWGEMLRTIGFAHAPGVLYVGAIVPLVGGLTSIAAWIWMLVAGVIAVRQALDFDDTWKAIATVGLGWAAMVAVSVLSAIIIGVSFGAFSMMS